MSIESPCVRNCCLDEQDVCMDCGRSLAEIIRWGDADDDDRREILKQARQRNQERSQKFSQKRSQKRT